MAQERQLIRPISVHAHFENSSFVMLAEHWGRTAKSTYFVLYVDSSGVPTTMAYVSGREPPSIIHRHTGFGVYHLEVLGLRDEDPTLEPVCTMLAQTGWNRSVLHFHHCVPKDQSPLFDWTGMRVTREWNPKAQDPYVILPHGGGEDFGLDQPEWAIRVHLADHGHFKIHVRVPDIYRNQSSLNQLLQVMRRMPRPTAETHPAKRA